MIAAAPGWRIVLVDRESGGSVALPIVAWDTVVDRTEPYNYAGGLMLAEVPVAFSMRAWYLPGEVGVAPCPVTAKTEVVGYLAPGEEHEQFWMEAADEIRQANDEAEERAYQQSLRQEVDR